MTSTCLWHFSPSTLRFSIIFVIFLHLELKLVHGKLALSSLQVADGICPDQGHTPVAEHVNYPWLLIGRRYYVPMASKHAIRKYAEVFLGRPALDHYELDKMNLQIEHVLGKYRKMGFDKEFRQLCLSESKLVRRFPRNLLERQCYIVRSLLAGSGTDVKLLHNSLDTIVWTDNHSAILVTKCINHKYYDWEVYSIHKELSPDVKDKILLIIQELGFSPYNVIYYDYELHKFYEEHPIVPLAHGPPGPLAVAVEAEDDDGGPPPVIFKEPHAGHVQPLLPELGNGNPLAIQAYEYEQAHAHGHHGGRGQDHHGPPPIPYHGPPPPSLHSQPAVYVDKHVVLEKPSDYGPDSYYGKGKHATQRHILAPSSQSQAQGKQHPLAKDHNQRERDDKLHEKPGPAPPVVLGQSYRKYTHTSQKSTAGGSGAKGSSDYVNPLLTTKYATSGAIQIPKTVLPTQSQPELQQAVPLPPSNAIAIEPPPPPPPLTFAQFNAGPPTVIYPDTNGFGHQLPPRPAQPPQGNGNPNALLQFQSQLQIQPQIHLQQQPQQVQVPVPFQFQQQPQQVQVPVPFQFQQQQPQQPAIPLQQLNSQPQQQGPPILQIHADPPSPQQPQQLQLQQQFPGPIQFNHNQFVGNPQPELPPPLQLPPPSSPVVSFQHQSQQMHAQQLPNTQTSLVQHHFNFPLLPGNPKPPQQ